jgi:hypothetical protein
MALILVGALFLFFAKDIGRSGLIADDDPGPRAMPITISLLLIAGGLVQTAVTWLPRIWSREAPPANDRVREANGTRRGLLNVCVLIGSLLGFLALVQLVGFLASTFLFAFFLTWWLEARWWHALLFAVALTLVIDVLFVHMFEVALPSGLFGFVVSWPDGQVAC